MHSGAFWWFLVLSCAFWLILLDSGGIRLGSGALWWFLMGSVLFLCVLVRAGEF
jgi:hypothetical protein